MPTLNLASLTSSEKRELLERLQERERRARRRKIDGYYPDAGPLRRELYPKHLEFFAAGRIHRERLMLAANRVGKTEGVGGYETTLHMTGRYPDWWPGRRFGFPISGWAAGATNETTRDIIQTKLLGGVTWVDGRKTVAGDGLIPGELVDAITWKQGVNDLIDTVRIRHAAGGFSTLGLKSYQQGRKSFEGTEKDLIWCDEEPPMDVYAETLVRTMTTNGLVILTFTPLDGMSEVVMSFLANGKLPDTE